MARTFRDAARDGVRRWLAARGYILVNFRDSRRQALERIAAVRDETSLGMGEMEAWQLYTAVERSRKTPGALAEVGVYKGGSARLICEARGPGRTLHLFDTFEGIPAVEAIDAGHFEKGGFKGTLDEVQRVLRPFPDVVYHPGLFPETGREVEDLRFAFVNLDVDTYRSTADALEFFYPRLNAGGQIVSHDYGFAPGVTKAFDEFFADRPEPVVQLCGFQCLVIKTGA